MTLSNGPSIGALPYPCDDDTMTADITQPTPHPSSDKAKRRSNGTLICDWCGKVAPELRRNGPRICRECFTARDTKPGIAR